MDKVRLGKTNLMVSKSGFGAIPIQRIGFEQSKTLLLRAFEAGINYYDTARGYSDSEEKIGYAFSSIRDKVIIATKSGARDKKTLFEHIDTSLKNMKTDYIDVFQMHNPDEVYPDVYEGMLELKLIGKIKHIGITYHSREKAVRAAESGLFSTLQFPLSLLSSDEDLALIDLCKKEDMGILAMKGLSGGLIHDATCAFAFLRQYENVVPLWGIERMGDLEEFIALEKNPPVINQKIQEKIDQFKKELQGSFCRGCGYCMPCSVGIEIPTAARISLLMNRMPYQNFIKEDFSAEMAKIDQCTNCGKCKAKCPYSIDIPNLLKMEYHKYKQLKEQYGKQSYYA